MRKYRYGRHYLYGCRSGQIKDENMKVFTQVEVTRSTAQPQGSSIKAMRLISRPNYLNI